MKTKKGYLEICVQNEKKEIVKCKMIIYNDVLDALLAFKEILLKEKWEKEYD